MPSTDGWRDQFYWIVKAVAYTAQAGDNILVDTTSAAVTVTLPSNPQIGDEVRIMDSASSFNTNNCTVGRNGQNIRSVTSDIILSTANTKAHFIYIDEAVGWNYTEAFDKGVLNAIDQKKVKSVYFATIASGTTFGTITKPANAGADVDFIMDEWGTATDALVSTIENGKPTFKSPVNAAGNTITTTFDTSGNYTFSDIPSPVADHALIYVYTCYFKNFNTTEALWESELLDTIATHNLLGGLQGGTADEYYHLTSAQHNNLHTDADAIKWGIIFGG